MPHGISVGVFCRAAACRAVLVAALVVGVGVAAAVVVVWKSVWDSAGCCPGTPLAQQWAGTLGFRRDVAAPS